MCRLSRSRWIVLPRCYRKFTVPVHPAIVPADQRQRAGIRAAADFKGTVAAAGTIQNQRSVRDVDGGFVDQRNRRHQGFRRHRKVNVSPVPTLIAPFLSTDTDSFVPSQSTPPPLVWSVVRSDGELPALRFVERQGLVISAPVSGRASGSKSCPCPELSPATANSSSPLPPWIIPLFSWMTPPPFSAVPMPPLLSLMTSLP